jgi:ribosomal protein S18 acetylase RimI-like enzyme
MSNIKIDFTPTEQHLKEIENWLIDEDLISDEGFYCNWDTIVYHFQKNQLLVLLDKDRAIGFLAYHFNYVSSYIDIIEIKPSHRRLGMGGVLVNNALDLFKNKGYKYAELKCSPESSKTYWKRIGFKEYSTLDNSLIMYKILVNTLNDTKELTSNRLELYDMRKYEMDDYTPKYVWNLDFKEGTNKLISPIVIPCKEYWVLRWVKDGEEIEKDDVKYFLNRSLEYGNCLVIEELKEY